MRKNIFYKQLIILTATALCGVLLSTLSLAANFQLMAPQSSIETEFVESGKKLISLESNCDKNACYFILKNSDNKPIYTLATGIKAKYPKANLIALGSYPNSAFALISYSIKDKTTYHVIDFNGHRTNFVTHPGGTLANIIDDKGVVYGVSLDGIHRQGGLILKSDDVIIRAILNSNSNGDMSATVVTELHWVVGSNMKEWINTGILLANNGDIDKVLATYPVDGMHQYGAVYNYVNSYCKGLRLFSLDYADNSKNSEGWLYSSEDNNIGHFPYMYMANDKIIVRANNTSIDGKVYFAVDKQVMDELSPSASAGVMQDCSEHQFGFNLSLGLAKKAWAADSKADGLNVDYKIANSLFKSVSLEGKLGDTNLAVSYLRNQSEADGVLSRDASEFFSFLVDFQPKNTKAIRITVEKSTINGVATIQDSVLPDEVFSTEYLQTRLLFIRERGYFLGGQYSKYSIPSAVGFSDSSGAEIGLFDKAVKIQGISLIGGYDELAYVNRYENDFYRWYKSGHLGIGLSKLNLSSAITDEARQQFAGKEIEDETTLILEANAEVGYIWQLRSKSLGGFGGTFQGGLTAYVNRLSASRSDTSDPQKISLEFARQDLLYGAFLRFSMIL